MEISPLIIGVTFLFLLLALMFMGIPIGFCFVVTGVIGLFILVGFSPALSLMGSVIYSQVASYTWAVLPLFVLMGQLAGDTGLITDAYEACRKWTGNLRGGLYLATTGACTIFAAVSGTAVASSITMTKIAWPEMKRFGYDPALSLGSILCGGTIAFLIPPSIPMVIFGMIADESIGRLFMAGIIPGILTALLICCTVIVISFINPNLSPSGPPSTFKEKMSSLVGIWSVIVLVLFVMGGIWTGVCTPNEAAGIGAFGALMIGFSKGNISLKGLILTFRDVAVQSSGIFIVLLSIPIFSSFLAVTNLPQDLANWVVSLNLSPTWVLIVILLIYGILGIPLEMAPVMMLTLPIFVPLLDSLGIDKVLFGVLSTITIGLSMITPPVGAPMFIIHGMVKKDGISLNTIFKGCWIFCIPVFISIVLIMIFPDLALWIPNTMYAK